MLFGCYVLESLRKTQSRFAAAIADFAQCHKNKIRTQITHLLNFFFVQWQRELKKTT